MTKQEKEKYMNAETVGYYCMCNWGGLEVLDIEYGIDDYVVACFNFGDGRININRHKIEYSTNGNQCFRKRGRRYYFNEIEKA